MKQKKYTMSRAALEARKKGARNAAKKRRPGKQWYSVSLGVDTVAAIDIADYSPSENPVIDDVFGINV